MASVELLDELRGQLRSLDVLTARDVLALWRQLDPTDARTTTNVLVAQIPDITTAYGEIAAHVAADFYDETRSQAAIGSTFRAEPASPAARAAVEASIRYAVGPIWSGTPNPTMALKNLSATVRRHVRNPARTTILANTHTDPARPRWARIIHADSCPFCKMLASRGAVYAERTVHFHAHDACTCDAAPIYNDTDLPERNRELADEWETVTAGADSPEDARRRWNEHQNTKTTAEGAGGSGGRRPPSVPTPGAPDPERMPFGDAVAAWTDTTGFPLVHMAAQRILESGVVGDEWADQAAVALLEAFDRSATPGPVLHWGLDPSQAMRFAALRPGDVLWLSLTGMSRAAAVAELFSRESKFIVSVESGARSLSIAQWSEYPLEQESLILGNFRVVRSDVRYDRSQLWISPLSE